MYKIGKNVKGGFILKKILVLLMASIVSLWTLGSSVYAADTAGTNTTTIGSTASDDNMLTYDVQARGFFWNSTVGTPDSTKTGTGYGAEIDFRDRSPDMRNWGFSGEFTSIGNGPRFVNTSGVQTTSSNGFTGTSVSLGNGSFGLVALTNYQIGGGRLKYFLPTTTQNFNVALYGDYFAITGNRSALGGGVEVNWDVVQALTFRGYADLNNVSGNTFPNQRLTRYEAMATYHIPNTKVDVFAGYRGNIFTRFYPTNITGAIFGIGGRF